MHTELLAVDPVAPDPEAIGRAADVLRLGGLVAFPTETVYGLGANALDPEAVGRIFDAKGRPSYNPLIVHVPDVDAARQLVHVWTDRAEAAAAAFWPGPLTLVLPKRDVVPDIVTAGLPSVAVRIPSHPVALALLHAARRPVAAPSANRSTRVSPTTAAHVMRGLQDRVNLVLDGGATAVGIESTVVDLTRELPVLLRPGIIGAEELEAVLGPLQPPARGTDASPDAGRPSPGMLDRHYAPEAELMVADDVAAARARASSARTAGQRVGVLRHTSLPIPADEVVAMPADPAAYARLLYASLHALDEQGCGLIIVEPVPDSPAWNGVRDRIRRGAHP